MSGTQTHTSGRPTELTAPGPSRGLAVTTMVLSVGLAILSHTDQLFATLGWDKPWDDADAPAWPWRATNVLMALTFLALALALRATIPRLAGLGRVSRVAGWVLFSSFALLSLGFSVMAALARTTEQLPWLTPVLFAFFTMFLTAIPLGVGLIRSTNEKAIGWLYVTAIPAILATTAIGALTGTDFGHPAIGESFIYLGTAALAIRKST